MEFTRRTFIHAAGLGAVGLGTAEQQDGHDWDRLRRKLSGRLVRPGDAEYDQVRRPFNTLYANRRPAAVARCVRPSDVQACVDFAANQRIPVAARSGGHSYVAYSVPENGLVIDLSALAGVRVAADGTATVGAGTTMIDLYEAIGRAGRALPAGSCGTVGIAGLALGGGKSVLNRKFGLTCDHLLGARIVTPDSRLRSVDRGSEPDLLWGLRGGGGGNFGVVTSFTFHTEPGPDLVTYQLAYPPGAATELFAAWQDWMLDAPDELWASCDVVSGDPATFRANGNLVGPVGRLRALLADLHRRTGITPTTEILREMDYLTAMRFWAGCIPQCGPNNGSAFVASSCMVGRRIEDPAEVTALLAGRTEVYVQFSSLGGKVASVAPDATAFPHRSAVATAQILVYPTNITPAQGRRHVREVRDGLAALVGNTGYVNYIDPGIPDWRTAYYGANYPRLRKLARRYDPDRVFAFRQGLA